MRNNEDDEIVWDACFSLATVACAHEGIHDRIAHAQVRLVVGARAWVHRSCREGRNGKRIKEQYHQISSWQWPYMRGVNTHNLHDCMTIEGMQRPYTAFDSES